VVKGAYGATSDKTIVRFDDFVDDVRCDDFFTQFAYEVRTGPADGDRKMTKGAYLIIDGGYHPWEATQAVRKDIECYFGRLKSRSCMLKTPVSFHSKTDIDNAFFTCVGLQNMLHDWDKEIGNLTMWDVEADWGDFDDETPEDEDDDVTRH
jgi:hypothetical protein